MPKPTEDEVAKEIEKLRGMRDKVRRYSAFGDDNRAQIRAMIRVWEENMSDGEISDAFTKSEYNAAIQMRDWMDWGDDGDGSPSEGWANLCS